MKRLLTWLVAIVACICIPLHAYAHDVPEDRNDCTIELLVRYENQNVTGGTLTAVKVGYIAEDDGNYCFRQEITGIVLENIYTPEDAVSMKEFYEAHKDTYEFYTQTQSVQDGRAVMTNLSTGLYLVYQPYAAPGYSRLNPMMVSVPYIADGQYQYNLIANVKAELEREPEPYSPPPTVPPDPELPQTGQLNWPIPVMAVGGMLLFLIGWKFVFMKKGRTQ